MGQRFDSIITWIENAIMLISYLTIILVVGLETIRRIITGEQASWGPEVAMGAFVWMSWFAMSSGVKALVVGGPGFGGDVGVMGCGDAQ